MKTLTTALTVLLLVASAASASDTTLVVGGLHGLDPWAEHTPCPVGLALSGGGARGLSSIGLLRAFEEKGIEVSAIAGTSMGGVIGGLYACGYDADRLDEIVRTLDIPLLISSRAPRSSLFLQQRQERDRYLLSVRFDGWTPEIPQALTGGQEITALLTRLTARANYLAGGDFTRFPIPFKTVGTDVISGELVVMSSGSLADAMRATMAFPLAFTGVRKGESLLMDGGMLMPVPVSLVRDMLPPGTPIVAVNTSSPLLDGDNLVTPVDIANQVTTIMTADKLAAQLALADLVVTPVGDDFSSVDFDQADSLIELGYRQGLIVADSICALDRDKQDPTVYTVGRYELVCADTTLARRVEALQLSRPFTLRQLEQDLKTIARTEPVYDITAELDFWPVSDSSMPETPFADLRIVLRPQPKVSELTFRFEGNTVYDDLTLANQAELPNPTVTSGDLIRTADRIVNLYAVDGYDVAEVQPRDVDFERMEAVFDVDEAVVKRINVTQNLRSRDWLVRSYVQMERNRPASLNQAARSLSDLYGTELFERVTFDLTPVDSGAVVTLRVQERKYSQVRFGWHWHDAYESEEFVEVLDDNVNGVGLEFLTHAQYGRDRQFYDTGLRLDRIFFTHLTARLQLFYRLQDRSLYRPDGSVIGFRDEDRWGVSFYLGQQIARLGEARVGVTLEELDITDHRTGAQERFGLRTINLESMLETFDRFPFPTSGSRHRAELRFAGKLLGGETEYTRFALSLEAYYALGQFLNYHPHLYVGLSRRGLPSSEKFYLGGQHSFAGYRTDELAGDKAFVFNQELRFRLPYHFYLTGRWDLGDVYTSADDIKPGKFKHGVGVALAVDTPIGPFEVSWGGGYSQKDRVYFSAGFEF